MDADDNGIWDGAASVAVGVLLVAVAYSLGRENKSMLPGHALDDAEKRAIRDEIEANQGIDKVVELMTMRLSPDEVLVAARVDVTNDVSGGDLERFADDVDNRVRRRLPDVRHVFLDPTDARRAEGHQAES